MNDQIHSFKMQVTLLQRVCGYLGVRECCSEMRRLSSSLTEGVFSLFGVAAVAMFISILNPGIVLSDHDGDVGDTVSVVPVQRPDTSLKSIAECLKPRLLHPFPIKDLVFFHQGTLLASLGSTIRIWDCKTGDLIRVIEGRVPFGGAVAIEDGKYIATIDDPDVIKERTQDYGVPGRVPSIRLWDPLTGQLIGSMKIELPNNALGIRFSRLVEVKSVHGVGCFVFATHEEIDQKMDSGKPARQRWVDACHLRLWKTPDMSVVLDRECNYFDSIEFTPLINDAVGVLNKKRSLEAISLDGSAIKWNTTLCDDNVDRIRSVRCFPGDKAIGSRDQLIAFTETAWIDVDVSTGQATRHNFTNENHDVLSNPKKIAWESGSIPLGWAYLDSRSGSRVQRFGRDYLGPSIKLTDEVFESRLNCFMGLITVRTHEADVAAIAVSVEAKMLAIAYDNDEAIHLFNLESLQRVVQPRGTVTAICLGQGGCFAAASDAKRVQLSGLGSPHEKKEIYFDDRVRCLALSSDNRLLAIGVDFAIEIWDTEKLRRVERIEMADNQIAVVAFSNDAKTMTGIDIKGKIWTLKSTLSQGWLGTTPDPFDAFAIGPDQHLVADKIPIERFLDAHLCAISGDGRRSAVFHLGTTYETEYDKGNDVFSKPGENIVGRIWKGFGKLDSITSWDLGRIKMVDESGKQRTMMPAVTHNSGLTGLRLSKDGKYLNAEFSSGQVTVVDTTSGNLWSSIKTQREGVIFSMLHSSRRLLLVAYSDGQIDWWDTESGGKVASHCLPKCQITQIASNESSDRIKMVVGTRDCGVLVHSFQLSP